MPVDISTLNEGQLAAVNAPADKPCLVIAGAGSGKTTTLTARLERLVSHGSDPASVVAMTFTRKAADEFANRLAGGPAAAVWSGTIHSFAYARLRAYRDACGEPPLQVIPKVKTHVRRLIGRPSDGYEESVVDAPEMDLSTVLGSIGHWQNELIDPTQALADAEDWVEVWCARIYAAYTTWKRINLKVDFGDMLGMAIDAYNEDPTFLAGDRERYHHALVDELQDTNTAQWRLAHILWKDQPIFGVGDPRQAIYEWRGARPAQLLSFAELWPDVEVFKLVDNYRSTPEIIDAAETLMATTPEASVSGRLVPNRPPGLPPRVVRVSGQYDEACEVVAEIEALITESLGYGRPPLEPGQIAVLYRTNAQSVDLEDVLADREIPYQVVGSKGFWARKTVVQLLSYLELAVDPRNRGAFTRAIMAPSRYLGNAFVDAAAEIAEDRNWPIVDACAHVTGYSGRSLNSGQSAAAAAFSTLIGWLVEYDPQQALRYVLRYTDFRAWVRTNEGSEPSPDDSRDDAIDKLVDQAAEFAHHEDLLRHAEKMQAKSSKAAKPDPKRVQLLTIHRAKGLEWPAVFVVGFCDDLLPHHRGNPDEERRLAYVAMTRARDRLALYSPEQTFRGPTAVSPFLIEAGLVEAPRLEVVV